MEYKRGNTFFQNHDLEIGNDRSLRIPNIVIEDDIIGTPKFN